MGNSNSIEKERIKQEILYNKALELYKQRLKNYDYAFHGNYRIYLQNIQAQFQLDCLPDYLKYGNNYSQNSDSDYNYNY